MTNVKIVLMLVVFLNLLGSVYAATVTEGSTPSENDNSIETMCTKLLLPGNQAPPTTNYATIFNSAGKVACAHFVTFGENDPQGLPTNSLGALFTAKIEEKKSVYPIVDVSHQTLVRILRKADKKVYATLIPLQNGIFIIGKQSAEQRTAANYPFQGGGKTKQTEEAQELESLRTYFLLDEYGVIGFAAITSPSTDSIENDKLYTYKFYEEKQANSKQVRVSKDVKFFYAQGEIGISDATSAQRRVHVCPPTISQNQLSFGNCKEINIEAGGNARITTGANGETEVVGTKFRIGNYRIEEGILGISPKGTYFGPNTQGQILDNNGKVLLNVNTRGARAYLLGCGKEELIDESFVKSCPCTEPTQQKKCENPLIMSGRCFEAQIKNFEAYQLKTKNPDAVLNYDLKGAGAKEDCAKGKSTITINEGNAQIETSEGGSVTETNCQQITTFKDGKISSPITPITPGQKNLITNTGLGRDGCVTMASSYERYKTGQGEGYACKKEALPTIGGFATKQEYGEGICTLVYKSLDACLEAKEDAAERLFGKSLTRQGHEWDDDDWLPYFTDFEGAKLIDAGSSAPIPQSPTKGLSWFGSLPKITCTGNEGKIGNPMGCEFKKAGDKNAYENIYAETVTRQNKKETVTTHFCGCQYEITAPKSGLGFGTDYNLGKATGHGGTKLSQPKWNGKCNNPPSQLCLYKLQLGKYENKKFVWASDKGLSWGSNNQGYGNYVQDYFRDTAIKNKAYVAVPDRFEYILLKEPGKEAYDLLAYVKQGDKYKIAYVATRSTGRAIADGTTNALLSNCDPIKRQPTQTTPSTEQGGESGGRPEDCEENKVIGVYYTFMSDKGGPCSSLMGMVEAACKTCGNDPRAPYVQALIELLCASTHCEGCEGTSYVLDSECKLHK